MKITLNNVSVAWDVIKVGSGRVVFLKYEIDAADAAEE